MQPSQPTHQPGFASVAVKAALGLAATLLIAAIAWAMATGDLATSLANLGNDPWVVVALIDLYLGFLCFIVVIFALEPSPVRAALWAVALCTLGNPVAVAFLLGFGLKRLARTVAFSQNR